MNSPFLHDWVFAHAELRPDAPAVATPEERVTYGELAERVRVFAAHLAAAGVRSGDAVVTAVPNGVACVVAGLALNAVGATVVEVNREWGPDVLARILRQTGARHAVGWGRDASAWGRIAADVPLEHLWMVHRHALPEALVAALAGAPVSVLLEDGRADAVLPAAAPAPLPRLSPEARALVLYTSGSTGRPRGVLQTFRNVNANSRSIVQYLGLTSADRALLVLPTSYCYGRSVLQTHLLAGASIFMDGRFAFPRIVMEALGREGCTGFAGVPLTFEIIRRQVNVSTLSFPRLRYLTQAGGAMAQGTIEWVRRAFAPAKLFVMYGQTEATARLSFLPPERAEDKRGSIGIPIPGVELRVVDDAGRELPRGETGHLVARGDNVTPGYLDEPEETAEILRDGWLWTGDLAAQDGDGFFFHRGRSKEILKIGGHRASPAEIEHVLGEHPDVAEAAVIGVPDALKGEVAAAFVVARAGRSPSPHDLAAFCRARLPAWLVPARFTLVASLPRNASGKLLRARVASEHAGMPTP